MCKAIVNKIIPFSAVDGPGNRTAIFLQECNFNCLYCHNPETINKCISCGDCVRVCPVGALKQVDSRVVWDDSICVNCDKCISTCRYDSTPKTKEMSSDDILKELLNFLPFISGITISGGECTMQSDFINSLFKKTKKMGISNYLDSNGFIALKDLPVYDYMDKAMIDLKSYDSEEHKKLTGKDNITVIENIKSLGKDNKLYEVRTVIVPDVLNNEHNVDKISKLIASLDPFIRYKIIKFRNHGVRADLIKSYSPEDEYINKLKNIALENGCKNIITV